MIQISIYIAIAVTILAICYVFYKFDKKLRE